MVRSYHWKTVAWSVALCATLTGCDEKDGKDAGSGGGGDNGSTETEDDTPQCSASFTLGFPDGTSTTLDYCERFSLGATYEFDPDEPPEVRAPIVLFSAVEDDQFECQIAIQVPAACGEGYYMLDGESAGVDIITYDCTGVDDAYEGSFSSSGYLRVDTIDAGDVAGNLTGEPLSTALAGYLSVTTETGITVTGDFSVVQDIIGDDAEESACASSDGDEDDDSFIDHRLDGDDCDDASARTFPGAAALEPELCARDADSDGYGDQTAREPVEAGADCNDGSANEYPGAVAEATEAQCMRDSDGDGYGDGDVSGTNYDAGTDCNDRSASDNNDDADSDGYSTCAGDCDDTTEAVSPSKEEVCDNSQDDNCDDRVDEYCSYEEVSGNMYYYEYWDTSRAACTYQVSDASERSASYCEDCAFHFYESNTQLTSGSSTYCRGGHVTWFGLDRANNRVFVRTNITNSFYELYGEITTWNESTSTVSVTWSAEFYEGSASSPSELEGRFTLYGDW